MTATRGLTGRRWSRHRDSCPPRDPPETMRSGARCPGAARPASHRFGRVTWRAYARVSRGAALERIDELRNAMAPVHEPEEELQVCDEAADRHQAGDHALAPLPDNQEDTADHDGGVDRLKTRFQSNQLEVSSRTRLGEPRDQLDGGGGAPEESEQPRAYQLLVQRRR